MGQNTATKSLKEANRQHTTQRDRRVRSFMHRMTRWARSLERDLLGTLSANRGGANVVRYATDLILAAALPEAAVLMRKGLAEVAIWSWDDEAARFVRAIPIPFWLRRVVPVHTLFSTEGQHGDDGASLMEFTPDAGFDIDAAFQKILSGELTRAETFDAIRELEFGSPTPEQLDAILTDAAWPDGMNAMERIVTVPRPEISQLRSKIHEHLALPGPDRGSAWGALANDIGDLVGNVNFKAVRIARTEGTRVAEDMLRESWKDADEFITGIQAFTSDDANVRPTHRHWHEKIYHKTSDRQFIATDGEHLPRFPAGPNCRCWDSPVMIPEIEAEIDAVPAGPEYQAALDRFDKEKGVSKPKAKKIKPKPVVPKKPKIVKGVKPKPKKKVEPKKVKRAAGFAPAATTKDAENWARNHIAAVADYSKTTAEVANVINEEMQAVAARQGVKFTSISPSTKLKQITGRPVKRGHAANMVFEVYSESSAATGKVDKLHLIYSTKNAKDARTLDATVATLNKSGQTKGLTRRGIIKHEAGHVLDTTTSVSRFTTPKDVLDDKIKKQWPDSSRRRRALNDLRDAAGDYSQSNIDEQFAEVYRLSQEGSLPKGWEFADDYIGGL